MRTNHQALLLALALLAGCVPGGGSGGGDDDDARPSDAGPAVDMTGDVAVGDMASGADMAPSADMTPRPDSGDGPTCGDGACGATEDCATCPADCGCPEGRTCNADAICEPEGCTGDGCGAPPRILTFNANVREITEGGQVVFSAVVTDPDGIADLIGGVLEDPGGASFGAFATAGEEGAYGLTLTWAELDAVQGIEFDGEATRRVVAVFFDQAGNRTTETLEITLHCRGTGGAACAGRCVSLDSAEHCGACGAVCDDECRAGRCECPDGLTRCEGVCLDTDADPINCGRCGNVCPDAVGGARVCADGVCGDPCPGAEVACDRSCTDLTSDLDHCGRCGEVCEAPANGSPICAQSECGVDCDDGHRLCDAACAPCPAEGVRTTGCGDDGACVATACAATHRLCAGACTRCPSEDVVATGCAADRCVATECRAGTHPCAEGCCPWRLEALTEGFARSAIWVDDRGPHLALGIDSEVRYGTRVGGEWRFELARALDSRPQNPPEVALVRRGDVVHVVYTAIFPPPPGGSAQGEVRHVQRVDGRWADVADRRASGGLAPSSPDLAVDGEDIWLTFESGPAHVVRLGEPWPREAAVTEDANWSPDIVADRGTLHLTWWYLNGRTLGYARADLGGSFETDRVDAGRTTGLAPAITLDRAGAPVIVHRTDDAALLISRREGGEWQTFEPLPGRLIEHGTDLTTAADGRLLGCFGDADGLYLLRESDDRWVADEVARGEASACSIALGPDGAVHLVFLLNGAVTYAY